MASPQAFGKLSQWRGLGTTVQEFLHPYLRTAAWVGDGLYGTIGLEALECNNRWLWLHPLYTAALGGRSGNCYLVGVSLCCPQMQVDLRSFEDPDQGLLLVQRLSLGVQQWIWHWKHWGRRPLVSQWDISSLHLGVEHQVDLIPSVHSLVCSRRCQAVSGSAGLG